jgi:hypothetical protein
MAADISGGTQVELVVIGVAVVLMVVLACVRAVRRRRYRNRRATGRELYDPAVVPRGRSNPTRQPMAPSFSSAPDRTKHA